MDLTGEAAAAERDQTDAQKQQNQKVSSPIQYAISPTNFPNNWFNHPDATLAKPPNPIW